MPEWQKDRECKSNERKSVTGRELFWREVKAMRGGTRVHLPEMNPLGEDDWPIEGHPLHYPHPLVNHT
jgi:hypothetical protein